MTEFTMLLQAAAAIASAFAALAALFVAWNAFRFQKNMLLKQTACVQIQALLKELFYLKSLTSQNILETQDKDVSELDQRLTDARLSVRTLEAMVSTPAQSDAKKVRNIVDGLCEASLFSQNKSTSQNAVTGQIDDAIFALQEIYHSEMK